jgi:hypothetical protein
LLEIDAKRLRRIADRNQIARLWLVGELTTKFGKTSLVKTTAFVVELDISIISDAPSGVSLHRRCMLLHFEQTSK